MPTGRASQHGDALRIDMIFLGVDLHPANGSFAVEDGGGKLIFGREPIRDRRGDITSRGEFLAQPVVILPIPGAKPASMNANHGRQFSLGLLRLRQVQLQMLIIRIAELDPFFEANFIGSPSPRRKPRKQRQRQ